MRIAITGIASLAADHVASPHLLPTCHHEWPMGEVDPSPRDVLLSRNIRLGLDAAERALADAGLTSEQRADLLLINGTTVGGMDLTEVYYPRWQAGDYDRIDLIRQHEAGATTEALVRHLGLAGGTTLSTACSSALNALIHGANLLRTGRVERVLVGGTEALTRFHVNGFASLGILSTQVCRPFQDDRDGINLGEGAAYLLLEDEQLAIARGAHIYGYLAGYANRCDAYHQTASSPDGDGAYDAMAAALDMSGLKPTDIAYLNAHGTATPNNDASEMAAIRRLFGENIPVVESTKPITGHTTSASGVIEAVYCLRQMAQRGYRHVMSNAFGFGGNDSSVVLSLEPIELTCSQQLPAEAIVRSPLFTAEADVDYKPYIPAMQARRMTPVLRRLIVAAHYALDHQQITCPDAIIVATRWGGMIPSVALLRHMSECGEQDFSPAHFMSSTHNAAAGSLARTLSCRGYNATFSQGESSLHDALLDAQMLLETGQARNVLVCAFDEVAEGWENHLRQVGITTTETAVAQILSLC